MRHLRLWVGIGALGTFLTATVGRAAEDDTYKSRRQYQQSTLSLWLPFEWPGHADKSAKAKVRAGELKGNANVEKPGAALAESPAPLSPQMRERAKVLRRQEVCDRLGEIARQMNDPALETQAQLLQQRAWALYDRRTKAVATNGEQPTQPSPAVRPEAAKDHAEAPQGEKQTSARPNANQGGEK